MSDQKQDQEWYSNKDLYEMMVELSKGLEHTNSELGKTQVLIRDYNGLRQEVAEVKTMVTTGMGSKKNLQWWAMFAVAAATVILACVK